LLKDLRDDEFYDISLTEEREREKMKLKALASH